MFDGMTAWVLVTASGEVTDGPVQMTTNQAMGHNQSRAHFQANGCGNSQRWEEFNAGKHVIPNWDEIDGQAL